MMAEFIFDPLCKRYGERLMKQILFSGYFARKVARQDISHRMGVHTMESFLTYLQEGLWIVVIVLLLLGYTVASGIRNYQLSSLRFYIVGESIRALAVIVGFSWAVLADLGILNTSLFGVVILAIGFLLANQLEYWQEDRMRKTSPDEWNTWANKAVQARQSNLLDRLLLPTRIKTTAPSDSELPSKTGKD